MAGAEPPVQAPAATEKWDLERERWLRDLWLADRCEAERWLWERWLLLWLPLRWLLLWLPLLWLFDRCEALLLLPLAHALPLQLPVTVVHAPEAWQVAADSVDVHATGQDG